MIKDLTGVTKDLPALRWWCVKDIEKTLKMQKSLCVGHDKNFQMKWKLWCLIWFNSSL